MTKKTREQKNMENIENGNTTKLTGLDYVSKVKLLMSDLIRLNSIRVRETMKSIDFMVTGGSLKILANHCKQNLLTGELNPKKYQFANIELMTVTDDGNQIFRLTGLDFTAEIFQNYKAYNMDLFEHAKFLKTGYFLKRYNCKTELTSQYEQYLNNVNDEELFI